MLATFKKEKWIVAEKKADWSGVLDDRLYGLRNMVCGLWFAEHYEIRSPFFSLRLLLLFLWVWLVCSGLHAGWGWGCPDVDAG